MNIRKNSLSIISWIITIFLQILLPQALVFFLWMIISQVALPDENTWGRWLILLFLIMIGFILGIILSGWGGFRLRRSPQPILLRARIFTTSTGVVLPLLVLILMGSIIAPGNRTDFSEMILTNWQPKLSIAALGMGLLGFYLPDWLLSKPSE